MSAESKTAQAGLTIGGALAIAISWSVNHSIPWGAFHGACGWGYVIYYALVRP